MYSIFLKGADNKWTLYQSEEGVNFEGTLAEVKAEFISLMKKGQAFSTIKVVHNTTIDLGAVTITDVTE